MNVEARLLQACFPISCSSATATDTATATAAATDGVWFWLNMVSEQHRKQELRQ